MSRRRLRIMAVSMLVVANGLLLTGIVLHRELKRDPLLPKLPSQLQEQAVAPRELRHLQKIWKQELAAKSADVVYANVRVEYAAAESIVGHSIAHVFGETLYDVLGAKALSVCDNSFLFGCYHGVITRMIVQHGAGNIREVYAVCKSLPDEKSVVGCRHGIGHGLFEVYGSTRLVEALELCRLTGWHGYEAGFGCPGGVFMEMNFPAWDGVQQNRTARLLVTGREGEPCSALPREFRPACYYYQVQLWEWYTPGDFSLLGRRCGALQDSADARGCWMGIGALYASTTMPENYKGLRQVCAWNNGPVLDCLVAASYVETMQEFTNAADGICSLIPEQRSTCHEAVQQLQEIAR